MKQHLLNDVQKQLAQLQSCLLYTSDAADERSSVDLGGRRIIKKKKTYQEYERRDRYKKKTSRPRGCGTLPNTDSRVSERRWEL